MKSVAEFDNRKARVPSDRDLAGSRLHNTVKNGSRVRKTEGTQRTRDLDTRDREDNWRERDLDRDSRERSEDPRDVFMREVDLPRGRDRELVLDRDRTYELNGEESRTVAAAGVFRVISERDVPRCDVKHLQDQGLIRLVSINARERGIVLRARVNHDDGTL